MSADDIVNDFKLLNEESSITGGKSVSEIVQILRTKANLKLKVKDFDDSEDADEQPNKTNQIFPWIKKFTAHCKEVIAEPDIKKLDDLITTFLKHIQDSVKECYKKPKRAYKLRLRMNSFLQLFNMIYEELKTPLEHTSYLDKMSDIMALYIDIELKSSRRGREHPKKISERICASLFVYLDKSNDHILDSVLKAKFFIKKYSDICCPIMARLLRENPGQMYETTYVRYLLSFKLWKKLAGKDHYANINKEAVAKLKTPPDFLERLKSGLFSNVLPYVSKSEKDRITLFFMQSPFNVKKKAQVFLKDEKKIQPSIDLERSTLFDDEIPVSSFFEDDSDESKDSPTEMLNGIWKNLVDHEDDFFDNFFIPIDIMDTIDEEENIIVDLKKTKAKEKTKKVSKKKATNGIVKSSLKKRKALKVNNNNTGKGVLSKEKVDLLRSDMTKPIIPVTSNEENSIVTCLKTEDPLPSLSNSPESKLQKPCATVEPEQCKEVTDSHSKNIELQSATLGQSSASGSVDTVSSEVRALTLESQPDKIETSIISLSNEPLTLNSSLETPTQTVDSTSICDDIKVEVNSCDLVLDQECKYVNKNDEQRLLEDEQLVAEEVVIGSDMEPVEPDEASTFFFIGGDVQNKPDQNDIMNVIGIPKGSSSFCSDSVVANSEVWGKDQNKHQKTEGKSLLENHSISNECKESHVKEKSSENQFLSSIVASSECNENYVSLYRRQDSYTCNEMLLTRLFSEVNADDGSDDDSRYQNRSRFAGGGKIPAFREHIEEAKSDCGDEFEALSPSSRSDSQQRSPMVTSPELVNSQPTVIESSPQESDQELKSQHNPLSCDIVPLVKLPEEKRPPLENNQLRELSVNLSLGDLNNVNDYLSKEKITTKGKRTNRHFSSHQVRKKSVPIVEESVDSNDEEGDEPSFNLESQKLNDEGKSDEEDIKRKRIKAKSTPSPRSKSKTRQSSPIQVKPPPQPVAKKRRSRRKR